jgi:hypothetical protein
LLLEEALGSNILIREYAKGLRELEKIYKKTADLLADVGSSNALVPLGAHQLYPASGLSNNPGEGRRLGRGYSPLFESHEVFGTWGNLREKELMEMAYEQGLREGREQALED